MERRLSRSRVGWILREGQARNGGQQKKHDR